MRILKNTSKELTVASVADEIYLSDPCQRNYFIDFVVWADKSNLRTDPISVGDRCFFWMEWLKDRPNAQSWLLTHGFVEWDEEEIQYSLDGRPGTVRLFLVESIGTDKIHLNAGNYTLMRFKAGMFSKIHYVDKQNAVIDSMGRIKEKMED